MYISVSIDCLQFAFIRSHFVACEALEDPTVDRNYDIFEIVESGPLWVDAVRGHMAAIQRAEQLATKTSNEIRVMYLPDNAVVAVVNRKPNPEAA